MNYLTKTVSLLFFYFIGISSIQAQVTYWYDTFIQSIYSYDSVVDDVEYIYPDNQNEVITGMALDRANKHIYISQRRFANDPGIQGILRMDFDGSNVTEVLISDTTNIYSILFDEVEQKLYWVQQPTNNPFPPESALVRSDLDGSNIDTVYQADAASIQSLFVDRQSNKIYWTDGSDTKPEIWKADMDGSNPEKIVKHDESNLEYEDLIIKDSVIFWAVQGSVFPNGPTSKIMRANLEGNNVQELINLGNDIPYGITIDTFNKKVCWTLDNAESIQRMNFDGTEAETYLNISDYIYFGSIGTLGGLEFDYSNLTTSTQDLQKSNQFQLYPNPSKGIINIIFDNEVHFTEEVSISIYNSLGIKVMDVPYDGSSSNIQLETAIPNGLYHLILTSNRAPVFSTTLMIIRD